MNERDRDIAAEETERANRDRDKPPPENAIWLGYEDYIELEIFMKDLIGWARDHGKADMVRDSPHGS
jgi:hypothetical protein